MSSLGNKSMQDRCARVQGVETLVFAIRIKVSALSAPQRAVFKTLQGSEAREAVALTAFQPQDMPSRHHQPLPHQSPAQNKRQRLAPSHSMHRQQHPPLPAIPVNNRHQPLPAIPEMASRGVHHGSRSRGHQGHAPQGLSNVSCSAGTEIKSSLHVLKVYPCVHSAV